VPPYELSQSPAWADQSTLVAGGCPEMPMFDQSCLVRHTDIREPHEKPGTEMVASRMPEIRLPASTSADTLARSPR
jgi:hypothetical protein